MANSQSVSPRFKQKTMAAFLDAAGLKAALYLASATKGGAGDVSYNTTGEVSGAGYSPGGVAVANANAVAVTGATAYWTPSAAVVYPTVTLASFDAIQFYRTSDSDLIGTWTFGAQSITAGTVTINMPANDSTNALLRA